MRGSGFESGFSAHLGGGFSKGFAKKRGAAAAGVGSVATPGALFSNFDTYIIGGTRLLHGVSPTYNATGAATRSNSTISKVLKVTSTVTVQGFRFVRVPDTLGNWGVTSTTMDVVLSVLSGGTIDGGAGTKTFASNSTILNPATGRVSGGTSNAAPTEYDLVTVYDAAATTLTAGTYTMTYRGVTTQIVVAMLYTGQISIPTTTNIYPDPANASNTTTYPVFEILQTAP